MTVPWFLFEYPITFAKFSSHVVLKARSWKTAGLLKPEINTVTGRGDHLAFKQDFSISIRPRCRVCLERKLSGRRSAKAPWITIVEPTVFGRPQI